MAHEVTNRVREEDPRRSGGSGSDGPGAPPRRSGGSGSDGPGADNAPELADGADRLVARAEALARRLRDTGAVLDQIVANRAEDLDTDVRLIREAWERRAANVAYEADRVQRAEAARRHAEEQAAAAQREAEAARREAEHARREVEEARRHAEEVRRAAAAELRRHGIGGASAGGGDGDDADDAGPRPLLPSVPLDPIDDEIFFSSLPAPSLLAYARLFKRLTSGAPDALQSLAAEGVTMEMIAVINQTWSALFASRTDLAIRFSTLIAAAWA
jgi:hypothetical protein